MDRLLKSKNLFIIIAMSLFTFALYYPSISYDFIHSIDDDWLITYNPFIKDFSLNGLYNLFFADNTDFHYHPVTYLSYMIDYRLFGLNPLGYKVHNLILHLACGIFMYVFLLTLTRNRFLSFFTSFIFLVHPLNMESIVWASCRRQSLSMLFFLISIQSYLLSLIKDTNRSRWFIVSLVFAILAILSKAVFLVFPGVFVLIYYTVRKKIDKKLFLQILYTLPIIFSFVIINEAINVNKPVARAFDYSLWDHVLFYGYSYFFYWYKSIVVYPLCIFYPILSEHHTTYPVEYIIFPVLSLFLVTLNIYYYKKDKYLKFFALSFFIVVNGPFLNLIFLKLGDMPTLVSNRYFYSSGMGIILFLGLIIQDFWEKNKSIQYSFLFICIIIFSYFFRLQLPVWRGSIQLMEFTVKNYPSEEIYYRLAIDYYNNGDLSNAYKCMDKADQLGLNIWMNNSWLYYYKRAIIYYNKGDFKKAKKDIIKVVEKIPGSKNIDSIYNNINKVNVFQKVNQSNKERQKMLDFFKKTQPHQ